ncbi:hypothetical protein C7974DRAFT_302871 [Boeremia exigua]|uniref:uncharacterized protein n=1 Tax=Boeremia exigua TaxID=749465 RepID=UPI001E8EB444|nr:uncharacterized protein C7974DRAFT_302871 [Boeremia exigua]KAH6643028.1 hypothetical protein C7974DRAFT_302871 [Boeremia exigua]
MSTVPRRSFSLEVDTATPSPSATSSRPTSTPSASALSNTCSANSDCAADKTCSNGICTTVSQAAPFAPAGSLSTEPTTHLDTGTAIGIGVGVVALVALMIGLGFWFFRIRKRRQPIPSPEAPPTTRDRSASTATKWTIDNDQKTLVASLPNSPQHTAFATQTSGFPSEFYTTSGKVMDDEEKQAAEYRLRDGGNQNGQTPLSPVDKALPCPPTEEKRYAINVNINKSMIFDDIMFNAAAYAPSPVITPHERAPRYRFEEYLPPVPPSNPRISITKAKPRAASTISSEYELENYPHGSDYIESTRHSRSDAGDEYDESQYLNSRDNALSKLEGGLSLPDLPPPSPSFSFRSYDWYQDIIGGDHTVTEITYEIPPTPEIPLRSPARGINPLLSNPPDSRLMPEPLSPAFPSPVAGSHLHPNSARLSSLPSPSSPNFRLSPTIYQPPNARRDALPPPRLLRHQSMVASIVPGSDATRTGRTSRRQSAVTQHSHFSRSWLPDDGLYLPEEGTEDSFEVFQRGGKAYSPLA